MRFSVLGLLTVMGCLAVAAGIQTSTIPPDAERAMQQFSKAMLKAHMDFLADDLLEGRGTGTRGQEIAARYVAAQFEALGLEPAGTNGTYFQQVPFREITVDPAHSEFALIQRGQPVRLKWGEDFISGGNPIQPDSQVTAQVVVVGYGVVNRKSLYDDYSGLNVTRKIVAMLAGGPSNFPAEERAHFASGLVKAREAESPGAISTITLRTADSEKILPWSRTVIGVELPSLRWLDRNGVPNDVFPALRAGATLPMKGAERLFANGEKTYPEILKDAAAGEVHGFPLAVTVRIHNVSKHRQVTSPNVLAVLRGSDAELKKEYVVYSAHTDHLGIGRAINGDSIYNGAADDAYGLPALLEMERAFVQMPKPPARSVMFAGFTAEEKGLLGADYFVRNSTVPIRNIVANLNMDGASVFYTFNDVVALGAEHTSLDQVVARDAAALNLDVTADPMPEQMNFIRNDEYAFVRRGVPAICINEGFKTKDPNVDGRKFVENWIATRYHSPSDDMNQPLNFDATVQFMQINFLIGYDVAQQQERPAWKPGDFFGELYGRKQGATIEAGQTAQQPQ